MRMHKGVQGRGMVSSRGSRVTRMTQGEKMSVGEATARGKDASPSVREREKYVGVSVWAVGI